MFPRTVFVAVFVDLRESFSHFNNKIMIPVTAFAAISLLLVSSIWSSEGDGGSLLALLPLF